MTMTPFFTGVRSLFLTLAGLVLAAGTAFAQPASTFLDCSAYFAERGLRVPQALGAAIGYSGGRLSASEQTKFEQGLCSSLLGAAKVAQLSRKDVAWLASLPVVVSLGAPGQELGASFTRAPLTAVPRSMNVTSQLVSLVPLDELVFVLSHELGHGVLGHTMKKNSVRAAGALAAAGGLAGMVVGKGLLKKSAGAAVAASGAAVAVCGPDVLSRKFELDADRFGVEASIQAGVPAAQAKAVAIRFLQRNPQEEESCQDTGAKKSAHPSTADRVAALQSLP